MVSADVVLSAQDLHRRLGRRDVLQGVHLDIRKGEAVGICGENGAGKSTLMGVLTGVLTPDRGVVRRETSLGFAPQLPLLYDQLTVWEHFRYFAAARSLAPEDWRGTARDLLERYRFAPWAGSRVATLSGGTQQKLNLALALLASPALLLLDEPYGGFEWETYLRFWAHVQELRAQGRAVVIVSHLFYDRAQLDRVLELRDGRLEEVR